jgi:hypothetical protein
MWKFLPSCYKFDSQVCLCDDYSGLTFQQVAERFFLRHSIIVIAISDIPVLFTRPRLSTKKVRLCPMNYVVQGGETIYCIAEDSFTAESVAQCGKWMSLPNDYGFVEWDLGWHLTNPTMNTSASSSMSDSRFVIHDGVKPDSRNAGSAVDITGRLLDELPSSLEVGSGGMRFQFKMPHAAVRDESPQHTHIQMDSSLPYFSVESVTVTEPLGLEVETGGKDGITDPNNVRVDHLSPMSNENNSPSSGLVYMGKKGQGMREDDDDEDDDDDVEDDDDEVEDNEMAADGPVLQDAQQERVDDVSGLDSIRSVADPSQVTLASTSIPFFPVPLPTPNSDPIRVSTLFNSPDTSLPTARKHLNQYYSPMLQAQQSQQLYKNHLLICCLNTDVFPHNLHYLLTPVRLKVPQLQIVILCAAEATELDFKTLGMTTGVANNSVNFVHGSPLVRRDLRSAGAEFADKAIVIPNSSIQKYVGDCLFLYTSL